MTGLIKTALALKHKQLPPSLNFDSPNPEINLADSPFLVNTELTPWETNGHGPRRAGVSSFGLGGTNAHLVLEEAPEPMPSDAQRPYQLLILSAKSETALDRATENLAHHLVANPTTNLADVAYTLQIGRTRFNHRRIVVCEAVEDAIENLTATPGKVVTAQQAYQERPLTFMFSGVGEHYTGLAQELYETEPIFKQWVDQGCQLLEPQLQQDLRDLLFANEAPAATTGANLRQMLGRQAQDEACSRLHQTDLAQPAVFVIEYALAQLLISWGLQPQALLGYSLGEYVAACVAEVFSFADALTLVAKRAQLIQQLETGSMLTVSLSEVEVQAYLNDEVSLSAILTPNTCVLGGPPAAIQSVRKRWTQRASLVTC